MPGCSFPVRQALQLTSKRVMPSSAGIFRRGARVRQLASAKMPLAYCGAHNHALAAQQRPHRGAVQFEIRSVAPQCGMILFWLPEESHPRSSVQDFGSTVRHSTMKSTGV
ncbi:hypothetical protein TcBrA4_0109060 [Trypanosoma cruzi]|nr:hypothetical protein TcBrA4_0109060 [Trypanosoma cruzi]